MVFGVTFRGVGYMALAGLLAAILDGPMLYIIDFANHEEHYLVSGLRLLVENAIPLVIVLSVAVMVIGNAINRRNGVVR